MMTTTERIGKSALQEQIRRDRRAVLIVNTQARNGGDKFEHAQGLLQAAGIELVSSIPVEDADAVEDVVKAALNRGHRWVIVGGGDGTISSVVDHFAFRDAVFGLLPLGTANSFARTLSIPTDLPGAVDVLVNGKVVDVDLGLIDDDCFANGAALGLSAAIAKAKPRTLKRWLGPAAYLIVAARELARHRSFKCRLIEDDGSARTFDALELRIANGQYHGGVRVAADASVESRDISLYVVKGTSRLKLARVWAEKLLGRPLSIDDVEIIRAAKVRIETDPPRSVSVDGEVTTKTPVTASVARQALHVIVPSDRRDLK